MEGEYLLQARNESCLMYRNINTNPRYFFNHLFFTNGNGIDFENGNPVAFVSFNRSVPWTEYYKQTIDFEILKEHYIERYLEHDIKNSLGVSDKTWTEAVNEIDTFATLTVNQIVDPDFWLSTFNKKSFFPYLHLSHNYFKLQKLNTNSDKTLIKVAIALIQAYIKFYTYIRDHKQIIPEYKPIISFRWSDEDVNQVYKILKSDLKMLKLELTKLLNIQENHVP